MIPELPAEPAERNFRCELSLNRLGEVSHDHSVQAAISAELIQGTSV